MIKDYGHKILTEEELMTICEGLQGLPERRLMPTWAYLQSVKYNGLIQQGDCNQPNLIFMGAELPIIKRLYPPEMINEMVTNHITKMIDKVKTVSPVKFAKYLEMRRYGVSIEKARRNIAPVYPDAFLFHMIEKYQKPFRHCYNITCRDADLIYNMGIDRFIELFYDRFYEPVVRVYQHR